MAAALRISLLKLITISLALLCAASMPGLAQGWPAKTVRILVPFGPGSTPDIVARLIAEGATLGISIGGPLAINTLLFSNLPYYPRKDIAPITRLVTHPSVLVLLKKNPGKYNFSSMGNGSLSHLVMQVIAIKAGAQLVHVPYPGSPQAIMAVIRNDVQLACLPAISVTPQAAAGTVNILAVSTAKRSPYLPDVPTLKEAGIDVEADAWNGLIAPGGTPQPVIAKIKKDVVEIIRQPAVRERLAAQLMDAVGSTPEEFRARIDGEVVRWAPVIQAENIKIN